MARFNANEADNYGGQGNGSFFGLKNDKDTAVVRFMYNGMEDVEGFSVHEVEIDGKKRYVNCLREYNEPVDSCPLCAAKYKVIAKMFIPLYDVDADEVKVWDRGKTFLSKISSLCARYNPLVATPFEIERNGKKGDTNTTYETYAMESDDMTLDDMPEAPQILGAIVLDKAFEDMEYFLDYGDFPQDENVEQQAPAAPAGRNPAKDNKRGTGRQAPAANNAGARRTPAGGQASAPAAGNRRGAPAGGQAAAGNPNGAASPASRRAPRNANKGGESF
jgi:hypothetical protein